MTNRNLLRLGIVGTVVAALCCATPLLAILLGAVGLPALVGRLDAVPLPAMALFLGTTVWALIRRHGQEEGC